MEHNAKQRILDTAVLMAKQFGLRNLKRDSVAREAGCATGLVNAYFQTMDNLRTEVLRVAIAKRIAAIVLEGVALRHPLAANLPDDLRADMAMRL